VASTGNCEVGSCRVGDASAGGQVRDEAQDGGQGQGTGADGAESESAVAAGLGEHVAAGGAATTRPPSEAAIAATPPNDARFGYATCAVDRARTGYTAMIDRVHDIADKAAARIGARVTPNARLRRSASSLRALAYM
jgi:hypothetical protein